MAVTAAPPGRNFPDLAAASWEGAPHDEDGRPWRFKEMFGDGI
jgi:hypothetical protein